MDDFRHYAVVTKSTKTQRTTSGRSSRGAQDPGRAVRVDRCQVEVLLRRGARRGGQQQRFGAAIVEGARVRCRPRGCSPFDGGDA